jgi:hypothetical protein
MTSDQGGEVIVDAHVHLLSEDRNADIHGARPHRDERVAHAATRSGVPLTMREALDIWSLSAMRTLSRLSRLVHTMVQWGFLETARITRSTGCRWQRRPAPRGPTVPRLPDSRQPGPASSRSPGQVAPHAIRILSERLSPALRQCYPVRTAGKENANPHEVRQS